MSAPPVSAYASVFSASDMIVAKSLPLDWQSARASEYDKGPEWKVKSGGGGGEGVGGVGGVGGAEGS